MKQVNLILLVLISLILISCILTTKMPKDRLEELNEKEDRLNVQIDIKKNILYNLEIDIDSDLEKSVSQTTLSKSFFTTLISKVNKYSNVTVDIFELQFIGFFNLEKKYLDIIKSNTLKFEKYKKIAQHNIYNFKLSEIDKLEQLESNFSYLLESKKSALENQADYEPIKAYLNSVFSNCTEFFNTVFDKLSTCLHEMLDLLD